MSRRGLRQRHHARSARTSRVRRTLTFASLQRRKLPPSLRKTSRSGPRRGLRRGETMYGQTIASVALCEAYAMTRDRWLEGPARRAVTLVAKGPSGGQRGAPGAASDTSVLGWQIMAIKSAQRAGFDVPTTAF